MKIKNIFNLKNNILNLKNHWQLFVLIAVFLLVKLFFLLTKYRLPIWDEGVYLGMGKYIFSLANAGIWEMIRPLGLPVILGAVWKLGLNQVFFAELIGVIFAIGNIILIYMIANRLFKNKMAAFLSAFLLTITPVFFLYSNYILTEIPSTFFVLLAVYFYIDRKFVFAGIASASAFMFRFPNGLIFAVILFAIFVELLVSSDLKKLTQKTTTKLAKIRKIFDKTLLFEYIKNALKYIAGFFAVILPFFIFNFFVYRKYTGSIMDAVFRPLILASTHQNNVFEGAIGYAFGDNLYNLFFYPIMILKNNLLFLFLIIGIIIYVHKKLYTDYKFNIVLFAFVFYLVYLTSIINKQERFLLTFLPWICLLTAYAIFTIYEKNKERYKENYNVTNKVQSRNIDKNVNKNRNRKKNEKKKGIKHIFFTVTAVFFILSSLYAVSIDASYYNWRFNLDKKPEIINNFYSYFENNNISTKIGETILITDPVFAAFTDSLVSPFYFEFSDNLNLQTTDESADETMNSLNKMVVFNEWEQNKKIIAIAYSDSSFPCYETDPKYSACVNKRDAFFQLLTSNYYLAVNKTYYGYQQYIFIAK